MGVSLTQAVCFTVIEKLPTPIAPGRFLRDKLWAQGHLLNFIPSLSLCLFLAPTSPDQRNLSIYSVLPLSLPHH